MKKAIIVLIVAVLFPSLALADAALVGAVAGLSAGGGEAESFCAGTGSGDATCEDFDTGSTACGDDGNSNCSVSWTNTGGGVNNQATGLDGTYAKQFDLSSPAATYSHYDFTAGSPMYLFERVNIGEIATNVGGSNRPVSMLATNAGLLCGLGVNLVTGKWYVFSNGGAQSDESTGPSVDTTYRVWIDYTKNSATGCKVTVSDSNTKGTAFGAPGYQTADTDASRHYVYGYYSAAF